MKPKKWNIDELTVVYHLTTWGYSNKEIGTVGQDLIHNRTLDSIRNVAVDVRKLISKQRGYVVSNYCLSPEFEYNCKVASKKQPSDLLEMFRQQKDFKPANVVKNRGASLKEQISKAAEHVDTEKPEIKTEIAEPTILDVMRLAKELNAVEVEYKGVKIKY